MKIDLATKKRWIRQTLTKWLYKVHVNKEHTQDTQENEVLNE